MRAYTSLIYFGLVVWMVIAIWRIRSKRFTPGSAMTSVRCRKAGCTVNDAEAVKSARLSEC